MSILGTILGLGGTVAGGLIGGPAGAKLGGTLGGAVGGAISGAGAAGKVAKTREDANRAAAGGISQAAGNAQDAVNLATDEAQGEMRTALPRANALLELLYQNAQGSLAPYQAGGRSAVEQLTAGVAPGGEFTKDFAYGPFKFEADPGYQFRLQQGQQAIDRSMAARGGATGGAALKAAARFGQEMGSQEYGNAYNRYGQDYGRAFDTFLANRANRMNPLLQLAMLGQNANSESIRAGSAFGSPQAANELNAAEYIGDTGLRGQMYSGTAGMEGARAAAPYWTAGGDARATGYANAANQWSSAAGPIRDALSSPDGLSMLRTLANYGRTGIGAIGGAIGSLFKRGGGSYLDELPADFVGF